MERRLTMQKQKIHQFWCNFSEEQTTLYSDTDTLLMRHPFIKKTSQF